MADREPSIQHPEDLPWNDGPADRILPATEEPAPAEIDEREGEAIDLASSPIPDPYQKYRRESLDERLAEEEPDVTAEGAPESS
jgi:hypothetical protein